MMANEMIYQLKVTLKYSKPPIWRRIQVSNNTMLSQFHFVLQIVMGWEDNHLHQFVVNGQFYGVPDPTFDYLEIENENKVKLQQIVSKEKSKFIYEYDFGDSWEHEILLEKILPVEEGTHYPVCLKGKNACPPEDCGGIWGYYDFVEAIQNAKHPSHEDMLGWFEGEFDPAEFDLEAINRQLQKI